MPLTDAAVVDTDSDAETNTDRAYEIVRERQVMLDIDPANRSTTTTWPPHSKSAAPRCVRPSNASNAIGQSARSGSPESDLGAQPAHQRAAVGVAGVRRGALEAFEDLTDRDAMAMRRPRRGWAFESGEDPARRSSRRASTQP